MKEEILHKEIPIPKVNECPPEKAQKRAEWSSAQARPQVDEQRAKDIEAQIPLKALHRTVDMSFGLYRLTGPAEGQDKSPLDMVLDLLKPYIDPSKWTQFKREFKKLMTQSFSSICHSNYNSTRVKQKNDQIDELLKDFACKGIVIHLKFVLHPETAEFLYAPRLLEIRNKIYLHFTGNPLDKSKYQGPFDADSPRRMDMHLDLQVTQK